MAIFFSAGTGAGAAVGADAGGEAAAFAGATADGDEPGAGDDEASAAGAVACADAGGGETAPFATATGDGDKLEAAGGGGACRGCASVDGTEGADAVARLVGGSPLTVGASANAAMPAGAIIVELGLDSLSAVPARGTSAASNLRA